MQLVVPAARREIPDPARARPSRCSSGGAWQWVGAVGPPGGGGAVTAATHAPFWQDPVLQGVPNAFGLILPALHVFLPFFFSHLPFLQIWHSLGWVLHLEDLAARTPLGVNQAEDTEDATQGGTKRPAPGTHRGERTGEGIEPIGVHRKPPSRS